MLRLRDRAQAHNPANSGQFASLQELSANTGLRGGAERIRTISQDIMPDRAAGIMRRLLSQFRHLRTASIARAKTRPAKRDCAMM